MLDFARVRKVESGREFVLLPLGEDNEFNYVLLFFFFSQKKKNLTKAFHIEK